MSGVPPVRGAAVTTTGLEITASRSVIDETVVAAVAVTVFYIGPVVFFRGFRLFRPGSTRIGSDAGKPSMLNVPWHRERR